MIWIDASFAIAWLTGSEPGARDLFSRERDNAAVLPAQYAEIMVYFARKIPDLTVVAQELEALRLETSTRSELKLAAHLYAVARETRSKCSLADAVLAATARSRHDRLLSFDDDFLALGMTKEANGMWR